MNTTSYDLNRPVHMGRRDVFLERASELFRRCLKEKTDNKRLQHIETTVYYLRSALEHAVLAAKSSHASPMEESFVLFIRMVLFYLHSALAIIENETQLENKKSPLWKFLHQSGKDAPTADFARGGEQLLEDVSHLFRMVEEPCSSLQKSLVESMEDQDRTRYDRAYEDLKGHIFSRRHRSHAITYGRTFYPALPTKNE